MPALEASAAASRSTSIAVASWPPADADTRVAAKNGEREAISPDIGGELPRGVVLGADAPGKAGAKELSTEAMRTASIAGPPPPEVPPALAHATPHHPVATHTSLQATPVVTIAAPLQQPQRFHEEAAASLATLVTRGVERAELRVTPPDLGPVEVRIDVSNGEATLAIVATQPATRDALEQALPLLRDLLAAQGLTLGESSVRDQRADTGSPPGNGSSTPRDRDASDAAALSVAVGYRPQRLVDVFA
jgi:flagellar hook-length control protein FliK